MLLRPGRRLSPPLFLPAPIPAGPAPASAIAVGPQEGKVVTSEVIVTSLVSSVITIAAVVLFQALFGTVGLVLTVRALARWPTRMGPRVASGRSTRELHAVRLCGNGRIGRETGKTRRLGKVAEFGYRTIISVEKHMGGDAVLNIRTHGAVRNAVDEDQGSKLPLTAGEGVKEGNELLLHPPSAEIGFVSHPRPHRDNLFLQREMGNFSAGCLHRLDVLLNVGGVGSGQSKKGAEVCEHPLVFSFLRRLQDDILAVFDIIRLGGGEI
uniref:Uncharacterized protein n=1 Tax=Chromera velia CCMP2878 TaxID=1169474 RepID=A0A0G4I9V2_9ALVE|eukprot:Cvel_12380.t1-p1 / transcript=Cvel_12380.t1 / gene=Cvel_12380 / organism=Chromera_velia_CCMP2878 / gene_product=hypothetical protein / transcript_product=hypothetical protein / location=Cvel_scaffold808:54401-56187(-) / protein_length=266 / sequence_SO=supercontig / SO=protein_coding / is_pseudo=false